MFDLLIANVLATLLTGLAVGLSGTLIVEPLIEFLMESSSEVVQLLTVAGVTLVFLLGGLLGMSEFMGVLLGATTGQAFAFLSVGIFSTTTIIVFVMFLQGSSANLSDWAVEGLTPFVGVLIGFMVIVEQAGNLIPQWADFEVRANYAVFLLFAGGVNGSICAGTARAVQRTVHFLKSR